MHCFYSLILFLFVVAIKLFFGVLFYHTILELLGRFLDVLRIPSTMVKGDMDVIEYNYWF